MSGIDIEVSMFCVRVGNDGWCVGVAGVLINNLCGHLMYVEHGGEGWVWDLLWLRDIAIKILGR